MAINNYLCEMPKVEIHLHLEGSIRPEILLQLADRHGIQLPVMTEEEIREWYIFEDFPKFIDIYQTIVKVLKTPDDFALISYDLGKTLAAQNVRYTEVTWTPGLHAYKDGLNFISVLEGVNDGRDRARDEFGIDMRWITDIARNLEVDNAVEIAEWVSSPAGRDGGIVALGLGGFEVNYPPELFEAAFKLARDNGLPANPHAGETMGPSSIWGSLNSLQAKRIGHGVRAIEDPKLVQYLVEHQIPLEVNPTSNICLNIYPSYAAHPLKTLFEAGVIVTINSDDPPMFNTTINEEYLHAVHDCGLTLAQLETAAFNAVQVSYLPDDQKSTMRQEFETTYQNLRQKRGLNSQ